METETNETDLLYKKLLDEKREMIDGLMYAANIQTGVYPRQRHFERAGLDAFVFNRPRNFVSGDFYWVAPLHGKVFFAAGDCTGHGASGAMLTMLMISLLNYAILNKKLQSLDEIMMEMDLKFLDIFDNSHETRFNNDWAEMTLCCYDKANGELQFSSANRKLMHVRNNRFTLYPGVPYPIGGWQIEKDRIYETQALEIRPGDCFYLGSDGFQTQFGGLNNKKYGSARLHNFLAGISAFPAARQRVLLDIELEQWKEHLPQTDDILIMGVKF